MISFTPMSERDKHRVEVRPGIFPSSPSEPGLREIRLLLWEPDSSLNTLLARSIAGLTGSEIGYETTIILNEVAALVQAVQYDLSDHSSRGQAACQAVLGQYHATEATVRTFSEDFRPGEAEGFMGVAHLVAALRHGVSVRESEGQDHQYAGATYLARAIVAGRAYRDSPGARPVAPQ